MMLLLFATGNPHKTQEVASYLGTDYHVNDLSSLSTTFTIVEDAATFEGNADIKANVVSAEQEGLVIADDSGLCVDALAGAPGVRSARYAGEEATMEENLALLSRNLTAVSAEERTARFVCVLSVGQGGKVLTRFRGECEGHLLTEQRGEGGFGYDPLFVPEGYDLTFAQLGAELKNEISHRARALRQLRDWLAEYSPSED